jgi:hypothetical protein
MSCSIRYRKVPVDSVLTITCTASDDKVRLAGELGRDGQIVDNWLHAQLFNASKELTLDQAAIYAIVIDAAFLGTQTTTVDVVVEVTTPADRTHSTPKSCRLEGTRDTLDDCLIDVRVQDAPV